MTGQVKRRQCCLAYADLQGVSLKVRRHLVTILRWLVLLELAYVFLFPVLFMLSTSFKPLIELSNPTVRWIPRNPTADGYVLALEHLNYFRSLPVSVVTSAIAAIGQTLVGALVGYGFARLPFRGRQLLFGVLLFTIIVPPQMVMIPQFMLYSKLKWMNTYLPLLVPTYLGYGVRGGILLVVYRQFFKGLPFELEDSAAVDGAGPLRIFWQIMLPLAKPAILVVFLFSFVWTWNDSLGPIMALRNQDLYTLPQWMFNMTRLLTSSSFTYFYLGENLFMAAVTLTIAPLLLLFLVTQRYFTRSIDRTGLVE
ncbi:MAG: carbohydrate ABC transporter permease [Caldilineaceae bacterium]|nr:carbohydrate ABC transporter permease [Caldilineaceae bacterium]MCY4119032.1 carbohydrate ABC transporter permease [Caldilineaceae bacterium]